MSTMLRSNQNDAVVVLSVHLTRKVTGATIKEVVPLTDDQRSKVAMVLSPSVDFKERVTYFDVDGVFRPYLQLDRDPTAISKNLSSKFDQSKPYLKSKFNMRLQLNSEKTGGLPHWTMAVNTPCPDITQTSYGSALLPLAAPVGENGDCPIRYFLASDFVSSLVGGDEKGGGEFGLSVSFLYASVVFTIGSFLRQMFRDRSTRIIYEEVPDTELLEDLINGVYIARIQGNLHVEYKLYHELIRIYRSPELLAHVTRGKKSQRPP